MVAQGVTTSLAPASREPLECAGHGQDLRRDRHRGRPQRAGERGLSRARRQEGARARAPPRARRRRRDRGGLPRLPLLGVLLRGLPAPPRDHPRAGSAPARAGDPAPRRHLHPPAERRLPLADERPRAHPPRDLPPLAHRRRGLRRVREGHGGHGPLREADPLHGPPRPVLLRSPRLRAPPGAGPALPPTPPPEPAPAPPAHDHERGGHARPVVRDGRPQGHHVGERDHRHLPGRALPRHRLRAAPPLHGRDRRGLPFLGVLARGDGRDQPGHRGRAAGVVLAGGEEVEATVVLSSADPNVTFLRLCEPGALGAEFLGEVRRYKFRGSSGKVNLALGALPDFTCRPGPGPHLRGAISISPSVEYMERAYDDAKYGDFSRRPYVDIVIPSLTDPSVAPPGKHVLSCFVQYAPYRLREGTWVE